MNKSINVINYYTVTEVKFPCLEEVGLEMNVNKCVMQIWNGSTKNKLWLLVIKKKKIMDKFALVAIFLNYTCTSPFSSHLQCKTHLSKICPNF